MRNRVLLFGVALAATISATVLAAAEPIALDRSAPVTRDITQAQVWSARGGVMGFRFNREVLAALGIEIVDQRNASQTSERGYVDFPLRDTAAIEFDAPFGMLEKFVGGRLEAEGGFDFRIGEQRVSLRDFVMAPSKHNALVLELKDGNGKAWLYIDHLMYEIVEQQTVMAVRTMDVRIGPALARLVQTDRNALGMAVADARIVSHVHARSKMDPDLDSCSVPNWPNSGGYSADVLFENMSVTGNRCRRSDGTPNCDGPGNDDGEVVFTPSSTLRNSNNPTTAEVPWYDKFSTNPASYPYAGNDQHPFLIWNLYRISANGQLEQIGRSGVKHAFLTTNTGCAEFCGNSHILGKGCGDTYGVGNNDNSGDLGPRSELIPAKGQWGRCYSVFDADCNQIESAPAADMYRARLITRESLIDPVVNPSAQYFFESWYIVRDDINIYNTMGYKRVAPSWGGALWTDGESGGLIQGPVINAWVSPGASGPNERNNELVASEGHARVAVKVTPIGGGDYRYDYAVMNFDFARALTSGMEVGHTFAVTRNNGFNDFSLPIADAALLSAIQFADGDLNATNDWSVSVGKDGVHWTAPAGGTLNWGALLRFSFVTRLAPIEQNATLRVAEAGSPASYTTPTLVPISDLIFQHGLE